MSWNDANQAIIEEFRANDGQVGGPFEGATLLLLHHRGATSGTEYVAPLAARPEGDSWVVFGSKGGAPTHPQWFRNLEANPDVTIEIGTDTVDVRARVTSGDERARIWEAQKRDIPQFAKYEQTAAGREIPVVILEPQ